MYLNSLLFRLHMTGSVKAGELAYLQYIEVTSPLSCVDKALGCVCIRGATGGELDRTLDVNLHTSHKNISAGEYYGLGPFSSIESLIKVLRSNISICPFSEPLLWPLRRFYITVFFTAK